MKTTNQFHWGINVGKKFLATTLMITGMSAISPVARAQAVNLGKAENYSTLSLDYPTKSTQAAITDAFSAGTFVDSLASSSSFASENGFTLINTTYAAGVVTAGVQVKTTISLADKDYVIDMSTIHLAGSTLDINAPAGAKVILDVSGVFLVAGGQIVVTGGLSPKNLLIELSGSAGGVGTVYYGKIEGTILAPKREVAVLGASLIQGGVYAAQTVVFPPAIVSP